MEIRATRRLHYEDPFLLSFHARVVGEGVFDGRRSVILDRTAFYAEAGGQLGDVGTIAEQRVIDVQVDDAGVVHHILEAASAVPPIDSEVEGEVDRARRRVHMALHTGQHMISRALVDVARAETISSRLGETVCTIDVATPDGERPLQERDVARAEALVNALIDDDVVIRAWFPEAAELAALPLRRKPKVDDHVRVVQIGAFDVSPCGGTHCTRSAQVGLVRVNGVERYKGGMRVSFAAGARARSELSRHDEVLRGLARSLTCAPTDVGNALDRVKRELLDVRESLGRARAQLAEGVARELFAEAMRNGTRRVVATFDEGGLELARAVAVRVAAHEGAVALLAARTDEGTQIVCDRGKGSDFDCGAFVKKVAAAQGGRGGGRADHAEGRLPAAIDWSAIVAASS